MFRLATFPKDGTQWALKPQIRSLCRLVATSTLPSIGSGKTHTGANTAALRGQRNWLSIYTGLLATPRLVLILLTIGAGMSAYPASADPMNNGESIKVEISATIVNAAEAEILPDMGPHREVTIIAEGTQVYVDAPDDFYAVVTTKESIEIQF